MEGVGGAGGRVLSVDVSPKLKVSCFSLEIAILLAGDVICFRLFYTVSWKYTGCRREEKTSRNIMSVCVVGGGKADNKMDPPLNAYSSIYVSDNETEMPLALCKQQLHNQEGRAE